jgi:hypothetical protein
MDTWLPYFYHYGIGGVLFVISIVLLITSGALRMHDKLHRRLMLAMIGGLLLFMVGHAAWIALATA